MWKETITYTDYFGEERTEDFRFNLSKAECAERQMKYAGGGYGEFLRKIVEGGTDESYGVHVAKLAGVPNIVTKRANQILKSLERKNLINQKVQENKKESNGQFDMFNYKLAEIAQEIDKINLNELTPIEALNTLVKIKEKLRIKNNSLKL